MEKILRNAYNIPLFSYSRYFICFEVVNLFVSLEPIA